MTAGDGGSWARNVSASALSSTQIQNEGYSRAMRELMNSMPLRFCAVMRITKPLIMKNSGTPMKPKVDAWVRAVACDGHSVA